MSFVKTAIAAVALSLAASASTGVAMAADLPVKALIKKAAPDLPWFILVDDRVTFSWMPKGTDPGVYSIRPNGSIDGTTAKQVYSFTHFDIWQYGTNFFTISMFKSDHNDPANPCTNAGVITSPLAGFATVSASCEGATEIYGLFRSTFGWNELFGTNAFSWGPLHNISFEVGMDANTENNYFAPAKRDVVAGLQFQFDLPYKGFFNVAPLLYYEFYNRNAFAQCGAGWQLPAPAIPGVNCLVDGNRSFDPTWAVETNYYMDLGFLPENMQFWSISGRAAWYGKKGSENDPLPGMSTAVEFNSEPIRLTFDASKAIWGPKFTHFVDVWVAYRYWQNKFGLDHKNSTACNVSPGVSNNSCTESTVYTGITVKF
ncbi:hypothetical protein [Bradyrhizobium sp. STM 3562]|uniref:hypothetical protein n=1 Tax=Bradyrhizobium sp. STM 3562 TaxID=578924 RepID=UPI00388E63AF